MTKSGYGGRKRERKFVTFTWKAKIYTVKKNYFYEIVEKKFISDFLPSFFL